MINWKLVGGLVLVVGLIITGWWASDSVDRSYRDGWADGYTDGVRHERELWTDALPVPDTDDQSAQSASPYAHTFIDNGLLWVVENENTGWYSASGHEFVRATPDELRHFFPVSPGTWANT